jgi:prepilin-type N-terminal cleavage/methylation domain-containing protein
VINLFKRNPLNQQDGFTLLEMLISLAVFAVGMLGLTSLFAMQIATNAQAVRHNVANSIALGTIEEAKAVPFYRMTSWDPTQASATIPCQGDALAAMADRVDCLTPDQAIAIVPAAPYDHFVSDNAFVPMANLAAQGLAQSDRDFTRGMEIQRTFTIIPDQPAVDMKTFTVQVDWRMAGKTEVHTVSYTTVRDMDIR